MSMAGSQGLKTKVFTMTWLCGDDLIYAISIQKIFFDLSAFKSCLSINNDIEILSFYICESSGFLGLNWRSLIKVHTNAPIPFRLKTFYREKKKSVSDEARAAMVKVHHSCACQSVHQSVCNGFYFQMGTFSFPLCFCKNNFLSLSLSLLLLLLMLLLHIL